MEELIRQANTTHYTEWYAIKELMAKADEPTRERLKWIMCHKRLQEEYANR